MVLLAAAVDYRAQQPIYSLRFDRYLYCTNNYLMFSFCIGEGDHLSQIRSFSDDGRRPIGVRLTPARLYCDRASRTRNTRAEVKAHKQQPKEKNNTRVIGRMRAFSTVRLYKKNELIFIPSD